MTKAERISLVKQIASNENYIQQVEKRISDFENTLKDYEEVFNAKLAEEKTLKALTLTAEKIARTLAEIAELEKQIAGYENKIAALKAEIENADASAKIVKFEIGQSYIIGGKICTVIGRDDDAVEFEYSGRSFRALTKIKQGEEYVYCANSEIWARSRIVKFEVGKWYDDCCVGSNNTPFYKVTHRTKKMVTLTNVFGEIIKRKPEMDFGVEKIYLGYEILDAKHFCTNIEEIQKAESQLAYSIAQDAENDVEEAEAYSDDDAVAESNAEIIACIDDYLVDADAAAEVEIENAQTAEVEEISPSIEKIFATVTTEIKPHIRGKYFVQIDDNWREQEIRENFSTLEDAVKVARIMYSELRKVSRHIYATVEARTVDINKLWNRADDWTTFYEINSDGEKVNRRETIDAIAKIDNRTVEEVRNDIGRYGDNYGFYKNSVAEVETEKNSLKAKVAEILNRPRKPIIDWKATFEDMKISEILNFQKDLKKFLKLGQIDLAENVFSMLKTLCRNYRAVAA